MRLVAWRKGSLDQLNLKRALKGQNFEFTGNPNDLIFDYPGSKNNTVLNLKQTDQRRSITNQSKGATHE